MEHQYLRLENSLVTQRKVNSHLVTVEVSVKRSTCQWMKLDSLTLYKLRLEGLDTKTVKCRSTVKHNWVTLHYVLKNIPNHRLTTINNLLSTLNSLHNTTLDELANNEWLVKLGCHKLWQTALAHLQLRTYNDYRTGRIVNTFTEEVLTETSLLTLERVRE